MTEQQIPKLVGKLVEHQSFFGALSTENAQWAIQNTQEAVALFVNAVTDRTKEKVQKILKFVTTIKTTVQRFTATDHFKVGEVVEGVKIGWLSDDFKKLMLPKVEEDLAVTDINVYELVKNSKDLGIRAEIGEANEEIKLANFWQVLKARGDGKVGNWLIGYITGVDNNLWAVSARWYGGGWDLDAFSVEYPFPWIAGSQVCSR